MKSKYMAMDGKRENLVGSSNVLWNVHDRPLGKCNSAWVVSAVFGCNVGKTYAGC